MSSNVVIFLHMGCNNAIALEAAKESGAVVLEQMFAGTKLSGDAKTQREYFKAYARLSNESLVGLIIL